MTLRWKLPLDDQLQLAAQWAHIDPASLLALTSAIVVACETNNPRVLDSVLRTVCPEKIWDWPEYIAYAERVSDKPTRLRMVAALAHRIERDAMWCQRLPQLVDNQNQRPLWQFRDCGDRRDPPACSKLSARIERFDSEFWQTQNPASCDRVNCRCTIRAYRTDETQMQLNRTPDR